ncbi:hypothetical protein V8C26DRAFT_350772 [Trichoderma gracile]
MDARESHEAILACHRIHLLSSNASRTRSRMPRLASVHGFFRNGNSTADSYTAQAHDHGRKQHLQYAPGSHCLAPPIQIVTGDQRGLREGRESDSSFSPLHARRSETASFRLPPASTGLLRPTVISELRRAPASLRPLSWLLGRSGKSIHSLLLCSSPSSFPSNHRKLSCPGEHSQTEALPGANDPRGIVEKPALMDLADPSPRANALSTQ